MTKTLRDISNFLTGHVFRSKISYSSEGNMNLLNMDAISATGNVYIDKNDIKKAIISDIKNDEIIKPGDILFKAKGLNNTAVLIKDIPQNTTVTSSCHIVRVIDRNFLPEFVCIWLNSIYAKKHFSKGSGQATGVTIASVSKSTLESLEIPQISIDKQKLISELGECAKQEKQLLLKIVEKKELLNRAIIERELQKN